MRADDFWKKKAFSTAASVLEEHAEAIESAKQAQKLKGVGRGCAAVVRCVDGKQSSRLVNSCVAHELRRLMAAADTARAPWA